MEEPESKYFRMGYPLPSPLMTNKRPSTEPAGNSSSNCKLTTAKCVVQSSPSQSAQSGEVNDLRTLTRPEKLELAPSKDISSIEPYYWF